MELINQIQYKAENDQKIAATIYPGIESQCQMHTFCATEQIFFYLISENR